MTTLSDLNDAITEAHNALEDLDNFDMRLEDEKSCARFNFLMEAHERAVAKVIALAKRF